MTLSFAVFHTLFSLSSSARERKQVIRSVGDLLPLETSTNHLVSFQAFLYRFRKVAAAVG